MKYQADDGTVFEDMAACKAWEKDLERDREIEARVDHFLDMQEFPAKRERTKARKWILKYEMYAVRQRAGEEAKVVELEATQK